MDYKMIVKPKKVEKGSTVGISPPSSPAHIWFHEKYTHAKSELQRVGFNILEGNLTKKMISQGYRTAPPEERAEEFMELICNNNVDFLMSTIGGNNSSSMLPYLDYSMIRHKRKIITGYSDVTALHMAFLTQSGLSTFYGPAVVPTFGEWPHVFEDSLNSFMKVASMTEDAEYPFPLFSRWSNHFRNAGTVEWKTGERKYVENKKPAVLVEGNVEAPIIVANLNTVCAIAGSKYFPEFNGEILLLEQMSADTEIDERRYTQLKLMGVFDKISGLIIGKPEKLNSSEAPFCYEDLILECVGSRNYPIVTGFDCSHTHPMHTIPQMSFVRLDTNSEGSLLSILKRTVES